LNWNLFIDDIRNPEYVNDGRKYLVARSFDEAVMFCKNYGPPLHVAFDHDLGWDMLQPGPEGLITDLGQEAKSGYDFAKWLVDGELDGLHKLPNNFTWSVHSSNPAGALNINGYLTSYFRSKK